MPYPINKSDGSLLLTLNDQTIDNTTTSINLVGRGSLNYGEPFAENFIKMLENFSNTTAPIAPLSGQLWYDSSLGVIKVYDGAKWKYAHSIAKMHSGFTIPPTAIGNDGDFWTDLATGNIYGPKNNGVWPTNPVQRFALSSDITRPIQGGGNPPGNSDGTDGDFYMDLITGRIYGPKANGSWPSTPLATVAKHPVGGSTGVLYMGTTSPPANTLGDDGAWYVDKTTYALFGPKANGAWPVTSSGTLGGGGGNLTASATPPTGVPIGHLWYDTTTSLIYVLVDSATPLWIDIATAGSGGGGGSGNVSYTSSATAPTGVSAGHIWFDTTNEIAFLLIASGTWVDISSGGGSGGGGGGSGSGSFLPLSGGALTGALTSTASISTTGTISAGSISTTGALSTTGNINGTVVSDQYGSLRSLPQNVQTTAYTLALSDAGRHISISTGGVTVPANVFTVGDNITIFNNSATAQSIFQGASVTMYMVGTNTTGTRTLSGRGLASILCVASNTFVITGGGLS